MGEPVQAGLAGIASAVEHEADLRGREDDPTPRGVVRAVLDALIDQPEGDDEPRLAKMTWLPRHYGATVRVLDVCAGYGCWASEMRRLAQAQGWPVHITGIELDGRKREHLAKWCDEVVIRDWFSALADHHRTPEFDIVIGNPHFTALTHDDPVCSMPAILLLYAPAVLLLHTRQAFTKSLAGRDIHRRYPPAWAGIVPGSVGFRGRSKGCDSRTYQASLWLRGHDGPTSTVLLPDPPARSSSWHWDQLPGTEDATTAKALGLPLAPGWSP